MVAKPGMVPVCKILYYFLIYNTNKKKKNADAVCSFLSPEQSKQNKKGFPTQSVLTSFSNYIVGVETDLPARFYLEAEAQDSQFLP